MGTSLRRLLTFDCAGETLAGSLDQAEGEVGILMATGGSQTRVGSHRMYERLSRTLADKGFPCFRYDRRGIGDSSGEDPGFRESGADLAAAIETFRGELPQVDKVVGLGLCDGATAIALHGLAIGLSGAILINPWLVETEPGEMAPAAVRAHYRERLLSISGWKKLLSGGVNVGKAMQGLKQAGRKSDQVLADDVELGLGMFSQPIAVILAKGDATAIAAAAEFRHKRFGPIIGWTREIDTDSHTFARSGDQEALEAAVLDALAAIKAGA